VSGDMASFYDVPGLREKMPSPCLVLHNYRVQGELVPYENKLYNIDVLICRVDHEIYSMIYWLLSDGK